MQYIVAVIFLKDKVIEVQDYEDGSLWATGSRVVELREKMTIREDDAFINDYYDLERRSAVNGI